MQASQQPTKLPTPFAVNAGGSYIRAIPAASQISTTPGAASLNDGFPPLCFEPVGSGGLPPAGQDVNGILKLISSWVWWFNAGGAPPQYDSVFATAIGGYPKGAILSSATFPNFWQSTIDGNTTNPDAGGANWTQVSYFSSASVTPTQIFNITGGVGFSVVKVYGTFNPQSSSGGSNTLSYSFTAPARGTILAFSNLVTTPQPGLANTINIYINGNLAASAGDSVGSSITDITCYQCNTNDSATVSSTVTASQATTYNTSQRLTLLYFPS